jgi:CspA family cold shock protein
MNIGSGINWTRLAIVSVLMCLITSFSAMAQNTSNDPLDAEAVASLIEELTDRLPDLIENEAQVTTITEKWGAHEDLAGKTKIQILKMLFADVKSVIEDKETQDNIWRSWAEEEKSEETPVETPPAPVTPPVETQPAPAAPAPTPAKPVEQSSCRAQGTAIIKLKQVERLGFINVGYQPLFATGTVRCFDEQKGFGFITPDDGGTDLFVHHTAINMDGFRTLKEGQKVQYEVLVNAKGQRSAVNVRAA